MNPQQIPFFSSEEKLALIIAEALDIDPLPYMNWDKGSLGNKGGTPTPSGDVECEVVSRFDDGQKQKLESAGLAVENISRRVGDDNTQVWYMTVSCNSSEIDHLLEKLGPLKSEKAKEFATEMTRAIQDLANIFIQKLPEGKQVAYRDIYDDMFKAARTMKSDDGTMHAKICEYLNSSDWIYRKRGMLDEFIERHNDNIKSAPFVSPFMINGVQVDTELPDFSLSDDELMQVRLDGNRRNFADMIDAMRKSRSGGTVLGS